MPNWFYIDAFGQQQGPVNDAQLKKLVAQQIILPDTPLVTDAGKKGKAGQVKGLFPAAADDPFAQFAEPPPLFNDAELAAIQAERALPPPQQRPQNSARQPYRPSQARISDKSTLYLILSLIMTGCCCSPLTGIPAIIFSILYKNDFAAGRYKSAARNARIAFWCLVAGFIFHVTVLAVSLPTAIQAAREGSTSVKCLNNVTKIGEALFQYDKVHGALPPLYTVDDKGNPLHSWRVLLLPYMEQKPLYDQIRLDEPWDSPHNRQFHGQMPKIYACPRQPGNRQSDCSYSVIAGGVFNPAKEVKNITGMKLADITGKQDDTLLIVEVVEPFCWMNPTADVSLEEFVQRRKVGSRHFYGTKKTDNHPTKFIGVAKTDGSVGFLDISECPEVNIRALALPGGSHMLPVPEFFQQGAPAFEMWPGMMGTTREPTQRTGQQRQADGQQQQESEQWTQESQQEFRDRVRRQQEEHEQRAQEIQQRAQESQQRQEQEFQDRVRRQQEEHEQRVREMQQRQEQFLREAEQRRLERQQRRPQRN